MAYLSCITCLLNMHFWINLKQGLDLILKTEFQTDSHAKCLVHHLKSLGFSKEVSGHFLNMYLLFHSLELTGHTGVPV